MASSIKDAKAAREFTATLTAAVLLFTITMVKIPCLPGLLKVFSTVLTGMNWILNASN
jgi:hypothetical protein